MARVAQAVRTAGHDVRLLDLQVSRPTVYVHEISTFRPETIGFSLNYLANVPEVLDLAKATKARLPQSFIFVGGHSASFIPHELLQHAQGAIDCVVRGEGEVSTPQLLEAISDGAVETIPGVVTLEGTGPPPLLLDSLDQHFPARDLVRPGQVLERRLPADITGLDARHGGRGQSLIRNRWSRNVPWRVSRDRSPVS